MSHYRAATYPQAAAAAAAPGHAHATAKVVPGPAPKQPPKCSSPAPPPDPAVGHLLHAMRRAGPPRGKQPKHKGHVDFDVVDGGEDANDFEEDHEFLDKLLQCPELNALVKAHNVILFCNQEQCPCVSNACQITADVMEDIRPYALMVDECRELYTLLATPNVRYLLQSHDTVAQRDYMPKLGDIPIEVDEDEND